MVFWICEMVQNLWTVNDGWGGNYVCNICSGHERFVLESNAAYLLHYKGCKFLIAYLFSALASEHPLAFFYPTEVFSDLLRSCEIRQPDPSVASLLFIPGWSSL